MSRAAREKGKRGEQAVARMLLPLCPEVRTKRAGGESADVDRGRDLLGTPGLCVQVKEMERPLPLTALDEACAAAAPDEIPIAFVKQTLHGSRSPSAPMRGRWCVVLRAEDWIDLMKVVRTRVEEMHERIPTIDGFVEEDAVEGDY